MPISVAQLAEDGDRSCSGRLDSRGSRSKMRPLPRHRDSTTPGLGPSGSVTFDSSLGRFPDEGNRGHSCPLFSSDFGGRAIFYVHISGVDLPVVSSRLSVFLSLSLLSPFPLLLLPPSAGGTETNLSFMARMFWRIARINYGTRMARSRTIMLSSSSAFNLETSHIDILENVFPYFYIREMQVICA